MLRDELRYITIQELFNKNEISVRTSNYCSSMCFGTLYDIIEYYEQGNSFLNIRNAGKQTYLELQDLCERHIAQIETLTKEMDNISEEEKFHKRPIEIIGLIETDFINAIEKQLISASDILNYFTTIQKKILEEKYNKCIATYSIRTFNRLRKIGFESFVSLYLFEEDNIILNINGFGEKSLKEVVDLKNKMKTKFLKQINLSEEDTFKLSLVSQKGEVVQDDFVFDFYKQNNHLPMFWILEQYLINDRSKEIDILTSTFNIIQGKKMLSLEKIAKKHNLTRERIRQIRISTFRKTFEITDEIIKYKKDNDLIRYAELLQNKDDWAYLLQLSQKASINQESFEIQEYLKKERCNLSVAIVVQIIAYLFRDTFSLFGGFDISNRNRIWKNAFLIKNEFTNIFDFDRLREDFVNLLSDNDAEYLLDIENYVVNSQCWLKFNYDKAVNIISIVRDILLYEFHLFPEDIDGKIKISATKRRNLFKVIYKILKTRNGPMCLEDIFVEFKKIVPEHKYTQEENPEKLRPYLQRHDDITYRKRCSIYILKEWGHIRSGTIRDAIIEFMLANDSPQTVETITEYVLQHFPETNKKSIHSTMSSGKNFIQFKNSLFGFASKDYPPEYEIIEQEGQRKTVDQRLTDFEKFIVENKHFPFSSSEDKEEESLYRWWYRVVSGSQTVTEIQQSEVERIKDSYIDFKLDKNTYEWNLNYNKFKMFMLENRRVPSDRGEEKLLYDWLQRTKNDFLNYRLSEEQRRKYIELIKLF